MHVCAKSSGVAPGLAKLPDPVQNKFANTPPPGMTRYQMRCSCPGSAWAHLE